MTNFFIDLFEYNQLGQITYAEPYAGGAGAGINLLLGNHVESILINDANIGVYSFWHYLLRESDRFIEKVENTPVTLEEWQKQHNVSSSSVIPSFELAFATFFLSRTNRSGIISAGPIGGNTKEKQEQSMYKIDCRYNKNELISRLSAIAKEAKRIYVYNLDAQQFLLQLSPEVFVYLDPPYYVKGQTLYMNHYSHEEHRQLSHYLKNEAQFKWVLSYDDVPGIRELYKECELYNFPLAYTAQETKTGIELLTHSRSIIFPDHPEIRRASTPIPINKVPIL